MSKRKPKPVKPNKRAAPVTTEEFDAALTEILDQASAYELLQIPGLYEVVSEYYNNEAIKNALDAREED